ncbi:MAG: polymer-forming cytoskeletal protein [Clostridiales bacterium]|nr:polymer-forming cytoskeletal protein [Clostridiales bacterium]
MGFKKQGTEKILTILSKDAVIDGTLKGCGPVRIDGRVQGDVDIEGDVFIGESAVLEASVKGQNIQVAGRVIGGITAAGCLEIMASGVVEGDVNVQTLQVADGAILHGSCKMRGSSAE